VVGHDFGAVAGYAFAARHRDAVTHLAFFEMVLPGLGIMEGAMSPQPQGQFLWHMGFQSVPDIPFTLISGHEREYLQWFFQYYAYDPTAITPADLDHYTAAMQQVGALRAGLELYQAFFTMGEQIKAHATDKLTIPVLAYGGASCLGPLPLQCMEMVATDVRGGVAERAGHWIAEERPGFVADEVLAFIAGTPASTT
jgi:pimeloyl-ACP methyl ester carboxylesterase